MSKSLEPQGKEPFVWSRPHGRCLLQVCGGNRLLNELIGFRLAERSGELCSGLPKEGPTGCPDRRADRRPCLRLDLVDAADFAFPGDWTRVSGRMARPARHVLVVLFNLPDETSADTEREALARGVRGLFYRSDSLETLERGIRAIVSGQVWFRRAVLYRAATGALAAQPGAALTSPVVTARERQALACLAQGMTNQEIADRLCVSLHTVKTHLYRVYRKIGARNRHQAALLVLEPGMAGAGQAARRDELRGTG